MKYEWILPTEVVFFRCYRADGTLLYSGKRFSPDENEKGSVEESLAFYAKGHPMVHSMEVYRFRLSSESVSKEPESYPVDRSPEAIQQWKREHPS